jgi:thymidine phosphorylase
MQHPQTYLTAAPVIRPCFPTAGGTISRIDARAVGIAVVGLGGGRRRAEDRIDHRVGLTEVLGIGAETGPHRPLALIHAASEDAAASAAAELRAAFAVSEGAAKPGPSVIETLR